MPTKSERHGPGFMKQLADWLETPGQDGWVWITCPRCAGQAYVHRATWLIHEGPTRPCTHCFYTSVIAERRRS